MGSIVLRVRVKPNSARSSLEPLADGGWLARTRAAPLEGAANRELIGLVAAHFRCAKAAVSIKSGARGRTKTIRIDSIA